MIYQCLPIPSSVNRVAFLTGRSNCLTRLVVDTSVVRSLVFSIICVVCFSVFWGVFFLHCSFVSSIFFIIRLFISFTALKSQSNMTRIMINTWSSYKACTHVEFHIFLGKHLVQLSPCKFQILRNKVNSVRDRQSYVQMLQLCLPLTCQNITYCPDQIPTYTINVSVRLSFIDSIVFFRNQFCP